MVGEPGDDLAGEAFRLHFHEIYRYLLRRTGSAEDAEELAQRVFVDAAANLDSKNPPDSMLAWLYTVAERRFVDEIRRRARLRETLRALATLRPEAVEYGGDVAGALHKALDGLNDESREVVVKKLFEGRSFKEIAAQMGSTEAGCKMRFSRAVREIRNKLAGEGFSA
jgi:RNA polymerase sigma-70 factor (ECF subfamily)